MSENNLRTPLKRGRKTGTKDTVVMSAEFFVNHNIKNIVVNRKWLEGMMDLLNLKMEIDPAQIISAPVPQVVESGVKTEKNTILIEEEL